MSRTRSDYMLEALHLVDDIESADSELVQKYTSLINDMEEKVDVLWCYMLTLLSTIKEMEENHGREAYSSAVYLTLEHTLKFLIQETKWEFFRDEQIKKELEDK